MNIFADYPAGSYEDPFAPESHGKYFAFLTNRKQCFSYLSYDIDDFSYGNNELYKAMPMGYTGLWVLERVFAANSENKACIFSHEERSEMQLFIRMTDRDGTQMIVSQEEMLEKVSADTGILINNLNNPSGKNLENYSLFSKRAKKEINVMEIAIVGADLLKNYNWH